MIFHGFFVKQALIPWPCRIFQCPPVFGVINHSHFRTADGTGKFLHLRQGFSYLCHFPEYTGVISSIMVYHRSMKLFRSSTALAHLEIQDAV